MFHPQKHRTMINKISEIMSVMFNRYQKTFLSIFQFREITWRNHSLRQTMDDTNSITRQLGVSGSKEI